MILDLVSLLLLFSKLASVASVYTVPLCSTSAIGGRGTCPCDDDPLLKNNLVLADTQGRAPAASPQLIAQFPLPRVRQTKYSAAISSL